MRLIFEHKQMQPVLSWLQAQRLQKKAALEAVRRSIDLRKSRLFVFDALIRKKLPARVAAVVHEDLLPELSLFLFEKREPATSFGIAVPIENAVQCVERSGVTADVVMWEQSFLTRSNEGQTVIPWMNAVTFPGESIETFVKEQLAENARRLVKKGEKAGCTVKAVHSLDDAKFLYHEMVVPFVSKRFEAGAKMAPFETIARWDNGRSTHLEAAFVEKEGRRIAGALVVYKKLQREVHLWAYGALPEVTEDKTLRSTFTASLNYHVCERACQLGYRVNFGGTRPWVDDGIGFYKRQWGSVLEAPVEAHVYQMSFTSSATEELRELMKVYSAHSA